MANLGIALGGIGQGFSNTFSTIKNAQQNEELLKLKRRDLDDKAAAREFERLQTGLKTFAEKTEAGFVGLGKSAEAFALKGGDPLNDPGFQNIVRTSAEQVAQNLSLLKQAGLGVPDDLINPETIASQFNRRLQTEFIDPITAAQGEGRAEAAKTAAQREGLSSAGFSEAEIGNLIGAGGSEFMGLLSEAEAIRTRIGDGTASPADRRKLDAIVGRVNRLSTDQNGGLTFGFDPDTGKVFVSTNGQTPPANLFGRLSGNQQQKLVQQSNFVDSGIQAVDQVLQGIENDPTAFGLAGSVRGTVEEVGQLSEDALNSFAGKFLEVVPFFNFQGTQDAIKRDPNIPDEMADQFDPNLPRIEVMQNNLAMSLAIARMLKTGSDTRALSSFFNDAKNDVKLRGLTSTEKVRQKLLQVRSEMLAAQEILRKSMAGDSVGDLPGGLPERGGDDLDSQLKGILGE